MSVRVITAKERRAFVSGIAQTLPDNELFCRVMAETAQFDIDWKKAGANFGWALANYHNIHLDGDYAPLLNRESVIHFAMATGSLTLRKEMYREYGLDKDGYPIPGGRIWFQELLEDILKPSK